MPIRYKVTHLLSYPTRPSIAEDAANPLSGDGTRDSDLKSVLIESRMYKLPITFKKNKTFVIFQAYPFEIKWAIPLGYYLNADATKLLQNLAGNFLLEDNGRKLSWTCAAAATEGASQLVFEILYAV